MTLVPILKVETWPIERITPYQLNPRRRKDIAGTRRSLKEFGWRQPIVVDSQGVIVVGHGRRIAALELGWTEAPVHVADNLSAQQIRAYRLADNRTHEDSEWDEELLVSELLALSEAGVDLRDTGFTGSQLELLLAAEVSASSADEAIPDPPKDPKSKAGSVYKLGPHRLMCGDSTDPQAVAKLLKGVEEVPLLHADPPYGMGKEGEGVENDNLYNDKLDAFQMEWWRAWRPFLAINASAYIWGNPEALWRLWYQHLQPSEEMTYRNEIVWDKGAGFGQRSEGQRSYSINTERLLFFMLGRQFFGNVNKDDFFEGFEPIRAHLEEQALAMGWGAHDVKKLCGVGMYGHWFSRSQWHLIPQRHYHTLQEAAEGRAFQKPYAELKSGHLAAKDGDGHPNVVRSFNEMRAHFDNTHDNMNEVWSIPRVSGEERKGHPTPKPVAACARVIRSSAPEGGRVLEPFAGSGATLIGAELADRVCYTMEILPAYCDVVRQRYAEFTNQPRLKP